MPVCRVADGTCQWTQSVKIPLGQPFILKGLFLSQKRLCARLALPLVLGGAGFLRSKGWGKAHHHRAPAPSERRCRKRMQQHQRAIKNINLPSPLKNNS